jgi:mono/diheme cytochrome c family protein
VTGFQTSAWVLTAALAAGASLAQGPEPAATPPGQAVFERLCADCHLYAPEDDRAPSLDALRRMSAERIRAALTVGVMAGVGEAMPADQVRDVAAWLTAAPAPTPSP